MNGQMDEDSKEHGKTIKWTGKGSLTGRIKGGMLESTKMTRKRGMDISHGLMGDSIKGAG